MSFKNSFFKIVSASTLAAFLVTSVFPLNASAQMTPGLPVAGAIGLSESYQPAIVSGITIHPDNPLQFDFLIDSGDSRFQAEELKTEAQKMINYFMAAITVPDDEMWVNLSPYEKDRIIADGLSQTEMGRDMLAQDFLLKQLTASLMSPEGEEGKKFWEKIYSALGTTDVPIDTFNKVWIVPEQASVFVHDNNVFVVNSYLKVMLEEDYLGNGGRGMVDNSHNSPTNHQSPTTDVKSIIRQTILPIIEQEINQGKTFANLRQIYNSMILATWYKKNLRKSLLGEVYFDQNKVQGIDLAEKDAKEKIYNQYVAAFKSGVYDAIKEEYDPATQQIIPRKYFSGGLTKVPAVQEMNRASLSAPDVHADFAVLVDVQPSNTDKAMIDVRRAIKNLTGWRLELEDWASDFSDVNQLKFGYWYTIRAFLNSFFSQMSANYRFLGA